MSTDQLNHADFATLPQSIDAEEPIHVVLVDCSAAPLSNDDADIPVAPLFG
jgi:hypothetical protein